MRAFIAGFLLILIALPLGCNGKRDTGQTYLGGAQKLPPQAEAVVSVIFPRKDVVITTEIDTIPFAFRVTNGPALLEIRNGEAEPFELLLDGNTASTDVRLKKGDNVISVLVARDDAEPELVTRRTVSVVPQAMAEQLLEETGRQPEEINELVALDQPLQFSDIPYIYIFPPFFLCLLDVDVHRPISQDPDEPLVAEGRDFTHGAFTLRNDDADQVYGNRVQADTLPIPILTTDLTRSPIPGENDLVRVDALNVWGFPNVYLFAFSLEAEADINLRTPVRARVAQVGDSHLKTWRDATKSARMPSFPLPVGQGQTSLWVEGLRGGTYRLVIGVVPPGTDPQDVKYDAENTTTIPPLPCIMQATLTVVVVDIFQQEGNSTRLTAFDVLWGGRPQFQAELWPGGGNYAWGTPYRRGAQVLNMNHPAVAGQVGSMARDRVEGEPATGATVQGVQVAINGQAPAANKARITGGFQISTPQRGNRPMVNTNSDARYPQRVSLSYTVRGETLVRPEPLEVILPRVNTPAAMITQGDHLSVTSQVNYTIQDAFGRTILAPRVPTYLRFYGAGLKAWEALNPAPPLVEGSRRNDVLLLTNNAGLANIRFQTAQRSQARVFHV